MNDKTEIQWLKIQNAGLKAELKYWKLRYFLRYIFWRGWAK